MIIHKYNSPKDSATGYSSNFNAAFAGMSSGGVNSTAANSAEEAKRLADTHLIFGHEFNGTQDVAGDVSNANNIYATGDIHAWVNTNENTGGNIYADVDIEAGRNITATNNMYAKWFIGNVEADEIINQYLTSDEAHIENLYATYLNADNANIKDAVIDVLKSTEITTKNLTVTGQAHFFELIIDKIKAAGGAVLLTPANGFKVDKVERVNSPDILYKLYYRANDGERAISDMWENGDQAICMSFNQAKVGTNYNLSNKYYWSVVQQHGTETIDNIDYHYIIIFGNAKFSDGVVAPEVGDEIAMLGSRSGDVNRQNAIYISAYSSLDADLKAPLIAEYRGINDFDLKAHKYSWLAANGNAFRGSLRVESGKTVEDYVNDSIVTQNSIPYLMVNAATVIYDSKSLTYPDPLTIEALYYDAANEIFDNYSGGKIKVYGYDKNTNEKYLWSEYSSNKFVSIDSGNIGTITHFIDDILIELVSKNDELIDTKYIPVTPQGTTGKPGEDGEPGADAEFYRLIPVVEECKVKMTGNLALNFSYRLAHVKGDTTTYVTGASSRFSLKYRPNTINVQQTVNINANGYFAYSAETFMRDYRNAVNKPDYVSIALVDNTNNQVLDNRTISVTLEPAAIFTIDDQIQMWVQDTDSRFDSVDNDIAGLVIKADSIQSTVEKHTNQIGSNGLDINNLKTQMSNVTQTATSLQYTVYEMQRENIFKYSDIKKTWVYKGGCKDNCVQTNDDVSETITFTYSAKTYIDTDNVEKVFTTTRRSTPKYIRSYGKHKISLRVNAREDVRFLLRLLLIDKDTNTLIQSYSLITMTDKPNDLVDKLLTFEVNIPNLYQDEADYRYVALQIQSTFGIIGDTQVVPWHVTISDVCMYKENAYSSLIEQTANYIKMEVDKTRLMITSQKVQIDGNTEINGTLTLNDDTGFILNGPNGRTEIVSQSIGSYSNFISATYWSAYKTSTKREYIGSRRTYEFSDYINLGDFKANDMLTFSNAIIEGVRENSRGQFPLPSHGNMTFELQCNAVAVTSVVVSPSAGLGTFLNIAAPFAGTYRFKVSCHFDFIENTQSIGSYPIVIFTSQCKIQYPRGGAINRLGYDGLSMNYGNGKYVYFGDEGAYQVYGDYGIRVNNSGLQTYTGGTANTIKPNDITASKWAAEWNNVKSDTCRMINSSGTITVQPNDSVIVYCADSGVLNLRLPSANTMPGKVLYVINSRFYSTYSNTITVSATGGSMYQNATNKTSITINGMNEAYMFVAATNTNNNSLWIAHRLG